jgi:hypothetical protein
LVNASRDPSGKKPDFGAPGTESAPLRSLTPIKGRQPGTAAVTGLPVLVTVMRICMARFKLASLAAVAALSMFNSSANAFMDPAHVLATCRDIDPLRKKTDNVTEEHYRDLALMAVQGYMASIKEQLIVAGRVCLPYVEYWQIPIVVCHAYVDYVNQHGAGEKRAYELVEDALVTTFPCNSEVR